MFEVLSITEAHMSRRIWLNRESGVVPGIFIYLNKHQLQKDTVLRIFNSIEKIKIEGEGWGVFTGTQRECRIY